MYSYTKFGKSLYKTGHIHPYKWSSSDNGKYYYMTVYIRRHIEDNNFLYIPSDSLLPLSR